MRVLFGNEFGGGFGHHARLLQFEAGLRRHFPEMEARYVLQPQGADHVAIAKGRTVAVSGALQQTEAHGRYQSRFVQHRIAARWLLLDDLLTQRLVMWQAELSAYKPDLVIAEAAPSLGLAAHGRVPTVVTGNGYTLPPTESAQCIAFRDQRTGDAGDDYSDAFWLDRINDVLSGQRLEPLAALPAIHRANAEALFTIPLFDIFWQQRVTPYLGPVHPGGSPRPNDELGMGVVAYFSVDLHMDRLVEGLRQSGLPVTAHIPGNSEALLTKLKGSNITLAGQRFELSKSLPGCGLVVHACSLGMSSAAIYAGVPQVGFFQHDEAFVNAKSLHRSQTGKTAPLSNCTPERIAQMMRDAYRNPSMRDYALALSEHYAGFRDADPIDKAVEMAMRLL